MTERPVRRLAITVLALLAAIAVMPLEKASAQIQSAVPTLIPISGVLKTTDGQPRSGTVLVVVSLYDNKDDSAPRWIEQQAVTPDVQGRYTSQFGATREEGLPTDLFTGPVPTRWIGVTVENEPEQPRMMLVSAPVRGESGIG